MENTTKGDYVTVDDSPSEEPTAFPYLLSLDADVELLENEPMETMVLEEEIEEIPLKTVAAGISYTTTGLPQANPTPNPTTPTPTTASSTATTPATAIMNHEDTYPTNETISTIHTQLADAQIEITSLRHRVEQSDIRILEYGQRMLTMENTLRQLMHMCPTLENTFNAVCNSLAQMTQHSDPVEKNTGAEVFDNKRNREEDSDNNLTQHQAKRPMLVEANATGFEEKKGYEEHLPICPKCNYHHEGPCGLPCGRCSLYGHRAKNCQTPLKNFAYPRPNPPRVCFECGDIRHLRNNCPRLKNRNNNERMRKTTDRVIMNNTEETG